MYLRNVTITITTCAWAGGDTDVGMLEAGAVMGSDGDGDCPWLAISELTLSLDGKSLR